MKPKTRSAPTLNFATFSKATKWKEKQNNKKGKKKTLIFWQKVAPVRHNPCTPKSGRNGRNVSNASRHENRKLPTNSIKHSHVPANADIGSLKSSCRMSVGAYPTNPRYLFASLKPNRCIRHFFRSVPQKSANIMASLILFQNLADIFWCFGVK